MRRPALAGRRGRRPDHRSPLGGIPAPAVVAAVLGGAIVRALALRHFSAVDADEAVTGAMAQALLERREWPVFFWGQSYGGSLEVGLVAALLAVLPDSALTLRPLPMATSAVIPFVIYFIGRRLYGRTGAVVAAVAMWCPVQALAWFQGREMLFYQPTLLLGLVVALLALRFFDRPGIVLAAAVGFLCGIGFWLSTNVAFFALPAALTMLAAGWRALPKALVAVPTAVAGAAPWILWNLRHGFVSLTVPREFHQGSFADHLDVYLTKGVPMIVGAASPAGWDLPWRRAGIALALGLGGALLVAAVLSLVRWRPGGAPPPIDAIGLFVAPFVFSVNPIAGTYLIPRYVLMPMAFLALVSGRLARSPKVATGALALVVCLSAVTLTKPFQFVGTRADLQPVEDLLTARRVSRVYADYWVTFPLAYRTSGEVIGSPFHAHRRPLWDVQVAAAPAPAYVFMCNSPDIGLVESTAARRGLNVERDEAGAYVVLLLSANLPPGEVAPERRLLDGDPITQHRCAR